MSTYNAHIAIVTGASRGLGLATSRALASRGWTVIMNAREPDPLQAAAEQVQGARAVPGDVADPELRQQLIQASTTAGGLDLLINNASFLGPSPQPGVENYPLDILRYVYEVNVLAPFALTQAALPMLRQRRGALVNVTSDAGTEPYEGWAGYGSSKAALDQFSNILAAEEPDIRVYRFDPGDMNTRMHQEAFPGEDISDRPAPERSVPSLMDLIERQAASGFYRASDAVFAG
ncbi:MAG: SDR family NAD(P)-dependent oxidoreductase [Actinomycetota bacterium]